MSTREAHRWGCSAQLSGPQGCCPGTSLKDAEKERKRVRRSRRKRVRRVRKARNERKKERRIGAKVEDKENKVEQKLG